jgi:hypothetical protein
MNVVAKRKKTIAVLDKELTILEAVNGLGPCSAFQVVDVIDKSHILSVMRTMHTLVDKGLLERVTVNNRKLYKTRPNYKSVRVYFRVASES